MALFMLVFVQYHLDLSQNVSMYSFCSFRYAVERGLSFKEIDARLAILEAEELEKKTAIAAASS